MSHSQKYIERPKVRFSQPSENSSTNSEKPDEKFNNLTSSKPRIKSIVTLEVPVKIIRKNGLIQSSSNVNTNISSKSIDNAQRISETSNGKCTPPDNAQRSSPCTDDSQNSSQKDDVNIVCGASTIPNCKKSSETSSSADNSKSKSKNIPIRDHTTSTSESSTSLKTSGILKPAKIGGSKIASRHAIPKAVASTRKKVSKKQTPGTTDNYVQAKTQTSHSNGANEKTPAKKLMPCLSRNVTTAKTPSCGIKISKPGTKQWRTRSKSSPVKKTILRDVNSHLTNVYVGPGVARYYSQPFEINVENEKPHIRPDIISGEKLSRPEYNSIICTIDELRKVQSEKFVTDVEHLPLVYKNMVNEKVSAALDFPPDEAIYKNLVDLSVNENQLPTRLTRSKDPEPRHRDIAPKLSDFFKPTYSEEYCSAVQIRPSSPELISNWSAFAISDKIFGWKHDMDQFY